MNALVINIRSGDPYDVYIGRQKQGNHFGNPFSHLPLAHIVPMSSRDESISAFRDWLSGTAHQEIEPLRRLWILANVGGLKGKKLGCFCAPCFCHGEVLIDFAMNAKELTLEELL